MFGYVRPYKSELLVREYEQYKSVYCELCRELGKSYGWTARFTLSYDCTFYALLSLAVTEAKVTLHQGRCTVNPMKKCSFIESGGEDYKKAAALSVLLTYHKLRDNVADENFWKSLGCRMALPLLSRKARKAAQRYPLLGEAAQQAVEEQKRAEDTGAGVDQCAEPTAVMLSTLFQELGGCDRTLSVPLERFGYFLGRWIYLMDAADDLEDDLQEGAFNPFVSRFWLSDKKELTEEERTGVCEACNQALNATVSQMLPPLNLLTLQNFGSIIENVVEKGIPEMQREILFLHVNRKKREKSWKIKQ